jgi:soluble lytic murein transglycosylase
VVLAIVFTNSRNAAAMRNVPTLARRCVAARALVVAGVLGTAGAAACDQAPGRAPTGEIAVRLPAPPAVIESADTDVVAAQAELANGRAWPATKRMVPVVRLPLRRTPEAMLALARAMAAWDGWDEVRKALEPEPWLGTRFDGEGYELLARSALERGDAGEARGHAEASLRLARDPTARAVRLVLLARALDRLDVRDSAAALYRRAADALPTVREWLLLREAGATRSAEERENLYAGFRLAATRRRVPYTEARTLGRFQSDVGAAAAYEALGDMPSSYRWRLASDRDPALRAGLRAGLLGYLQRDASGETLQRGLEVLDAAFPTLDETSELLVARLASAGGIPARAAAGFASVPQALLTDADVVLWGRALIAVGRPTAAGSLIGDRRIAAGPDAAEARYVRAYALVRAGATVQARAAIARVLTLHGASSYAADARYLLADLESDAGRDTRARALFETACNATPVGIYSDDACMRAGVLSLALGDARRAALILDTLPARFPESVDAVAALYWAGRAWARVGDSTSARDRWRAVIARDPLSYYATRSVARLDTTVWSPVLTPIPVSPLYQSALARAAALRQLGLFAEEGYELDEIEREASVTPALALGAGAALLQRGELPRAIRLGWRAVAAAREMHDSTARVDDRGYLLVFPLLREAELLARARANDVDPAIVAAVIRQESGWNPRAASSAGARGLMQVLPRTGAEIASSRHYPAWDPALLFVADVSLELGSAHLGAALSHYNEISRALAAYNAGATRVRRWMERSGADDPEMFVERIPFVETRDYVRIVLRNAELYRALHGLRRR